MFTGLIMFLGYLTFLFLGGILAVGVIETIKNATKKVIEQNMNSAFERGKNNENE